MAFLGPVRRVSFANWTHLPIEFRWNTRAIMLDPREAEAILDKTRKKWRSKIRGWRDQILKTESGAINLYASEMAGTQSRPWG